MNSMVSIIIPTYNRAHVLLKCIDSARKQKYRPIEVIVVDDGSKDNTREIVSEYQSQIAEEAFYLYYYYKKNSGPAASRNVGISNASGDYIYFFDSDDYMYPGLINNAVNKIESDKSDCVIFGFDFSTSQGTTGCFLPPVDIVPLEAFLRGLLWGYTYIVLRRSTLLREIGYWNESLYIAEDYEYLGRTLMASKKSSVLRKNLFCVNREENSLGKRKNEKIGLSNRLAAEKKIIRLLKNRNDISKNIKRAYAGRLYKQAIRLHAINESGFSKALGELAQEIDCGYLGLKERCKRIVWRQGRVFSFIWYKSASVFSYINKKLKYIGTVGSD